MDNLCALTAFEFLSRVKEKKLSASNVAECVIDCYNRIEPKIGGFAYFDKASLRLRAGMLDSNLSQENSLKKIPIARVPIAIKDNICVDNEPTTCASKILKDFRPPYDAAVIEKVKAAGALLLGKSNMDEFAFGSSCETSCYGATKNPYSLDRIPGGSSGGSAALTASGETVLALGSDTGGSIRQPAAMCGVVGLKPTYGRVSRYGLIAFGSSLDQIGPITKDVSDCALLLNIISGYDHRDSTSVNKPVPDYTKSLVNNVKGLRIGLPKEYFIKGLNNDVKKSIEEAVSVLKSLGAEFKEISLPHTEYAVSVYYIVGCSEASSNLARFDGVRYGLRKNKPDCSEAFITMSSATRAAGFGLEAKRRIILGTYSLSSGYYDAYYLKAQKVRTLIRKDFENAFSCCDIILTPTSPATAFKIGEKISDPLSMYLSDIFTIPANLSGIPAISLPCGYDDKGLPIGLQLMAGHFNEEKLIQAAYTYEKNARWKRIKPALRP
jgi:aspartyl-tRNA(Asn)/glutamyl-tRNA(Gln) amidotransferase subunit A